MSSLLVINADGPETRVALVEDGFLAELYIERKRERGIAGNIYKGRVERVLPGMQAAFVNIGLEKSAYLHVSDVRGTPDDLKGLLSGDQTRAAEEEDDDEADRRRAGGGARIEDLLKEGQEIVVQVTKEPISTKGARATRYVSLPGRHLVFMPTVDHVGISRRIASDRERRRLREIVDSMRPPGSGFVVRTVAEGVAEKELKSDMEFLIKLWNEVVKRSESSRCPALIYNDLDLLLRTVRDLFTTDVEKLIIDSRSEYERVKKFIAAFMPDFAGNIELYLGADPIFDGYGIEIEIDRALERKVWLKSGGYLIVDEMEALTAIDVNTGRFVGKSSLEDTITKTNLEACREVAEQLRIRSIGGMIVVDFIDMDRPHNREKVTRAFNDYLRRDRSKAAVTRISELGLIEMTRKRTRESLLHSLTEPCSSCEGKGYTKSRSTVAYELLRELRRQGDMIESDTIIIEVHPDVAQVLATTDHGFLEDLEKRLQKRLVVKSRGSFHMEDFEIHSPGEKAIEKSEMAGGRDKERDEPKRRHRRKRALGSPADVEAMLAEEESSALSPESMTPDSPGEENEAVNGGADTGTPMAALSSEEAAREAGTETGLGRAPQGPADAPQLENGDGAGRILGSNGERHAVESIGASTVGSMPDRAGRDETSRPPEGDDKALPPEALPGGPAPVDSDKV